MSNFKKDLQTCPPTMAGHIPSHRIMYKTFFLFKTAALMLTVYSLSATVSQLRTRALLQKILKKFCKSQI